MKKHRRMDGSEVGGLIIKYLFNMEYKEEYHEVILDFSLDTSLRNGYLITNSLGADVFGDLATLKTEINELLQLLQEKTQLYKGGGNVNLIKSNKFTTTIEDMFAESDEEGSLCELQTIDYVRIILLWAKVNFVYKMKQGVLSQKKAELAIDWINLTDIEVCKFKSL